MRSNHRILAVLLSLVIAMALPVWASAADTGSASIGFSAGGITYEPLGISSVTSSLGLSFGRHDIDTSTPTKTYRADNKAGYVVNNRSGGTRGYTVTLSLSPFDNGLEGATLTLSPDRQGLVSGMPGAQNPPVLLNNMSAVTLEADAMSSVAVLKGTTSLLDPGHTATGYWGVNLEGDLNVYTNTVRPGNSSAVMTWELTIA